MSANEFLMRLETMGTSLPEAAPRQAVDTITRETFNKIEVMIPNLDIQEKISSILVVIDDKIELNNRINNNLVA